MKTSDVIVEVPVQHISPLSSITHHCHTHSLTHSLTHLFFHSFITLQSMLDKKTRDLVSFLDGSLRNCESVLFTPPDPSSTTPSLTHSIPSLRPDLSARQVAKLYGFTQKLLTKHVDQIGLGLDPGDSWYQEEVSAPLHHYITHHSSLCVSITVG